MIAHPEYVKCIAKNRQPDARVESWCGRAVTSEWHFTDMEHAALNNEQGGRLLPCARCLAAAVCALRFNRAYDSESAEAERSVDDLVAQAIEDGRAQGRDAGREEALYRLEQHQCGCMKCGDCEDLEGVIEGKPTA